MKLLTRALTLVFIVAPLFAAESQRARVERVTSRLMREGDVPGVAIVAIHGSRITWHRNFGLANAETHQPLEDESIFETASLSKPVFAYAVLKLVDAGVLSLDTPLHKYLPEAVSDERMKRITARMVLSHTTGFQNEVMPGETLRVHFDPGTRFSYSGAGLLYLQHVIEHVTGKKLPVLMRELVFDPLGIRSASCVWLPQFERTKVFGHTAAGSVAARRKPLQPALPMLHMTALDYARFVIAVMNGEGLKPATAAAMLATQSAIDESCYNCLTAGSGPMSTSLSWGLGWGLERTARGQAFWHWGENNGEIQNFAIGYPDGDGLVVFTNSGNGLSIMPELVTAALPGRHPAFAWMRYESYDSPTRLFWREALANGAASALRMPLAKELNESQINRIGYWLLARKHFDDAVTVLRYNVERHPDSFNAHDSLGEAYLASGDRANAARHYERSLALNRENSNAAEVLRRLAIP